MFKTQSKSLVLLFIGIFTIFTNLDAQELRPTNISDSACIPSAEICGSGIDEDCDGVDLKCPGSDGDRDGYNSSEDCDDGNKFVYPGVSVSCSASCGDGIKTCNSGSFTTCSCTPLCEKLANGRCFYVDPVNGVDSNAGNFSNPLRSLLRFASYSGGTSSPNNKISLIPGDVIYMKSGIYNHTYNADGQAVILKLINVNGTSAARIWFKAYPGHYPIVKPTGNAQAFSTQASSWLGFSGITIDDSYGEGIRFNDSSQIEVSNSIIKNTKGVDNNNLAGIKITTSRDINLHHIILNDNYDRDNLDTGGNKTENSRNLVAFGGGNIRLNYSNIFHTPNTTAQKTGTCIAYKHSSTLPNSIFEVGNNIFRNCYASAIGTAGSGGRFHHNLFIDSDTAVYLHVYGQSYPPVIGDNIIEYNTSFNTLFFNARFKEAYDFNGSIGLNTIRNNIIHDKASYNAFNALYTVDPYGSDDSMNQVRTVPYLLSNNNCFYNENTSLRFAYYSSSNGPNSSGGGLYSFSSWKGLNFDTNSIETDPELSSNTFFPANSSCLNKGMYAQ